MRLFKNTTTEKKTIRAIKVGDTHTHHPLLLFVIITIGQARRSLEVRQGELAQLLLVLGGHDRLRPSHGHRCGVARDTPAEILSLVVFVPSADDKKKRGGIMDP